MIAALAFVAFVALAAIAALVYLQREAARERAALLDRIQAPAAAQMAAVYRAAETRPPDDDEDDDLKFGYEIRPRDDLALAERLGG